jgi:hypothetical protein
MKSKIVQLRNKELLKHPADSIFQDGYGQIPKMVMCDKDLDFGAKAVYSYLCSFSGGGNQAFPGVTRICADLKMARNTFYKYMKQLEGAGYIVKYQCQDYGSRFANNVYEFVYKVPEKKQDTKTR